MDPHLSPNAIVPHRARPRVTALRLGRFDPLVAVAMAVSIGILTDHHSSLEAPFTGAGTLERADGVSARSDQWEERVFILAMSIN